MPFLKFHHVWYTKEELKTLNLEHHLETCGLVERVFSPHQNFGSRSKNHNFVASHPEGYRGFPKGYAAKYMGFDGGDLRVTDGGRWGKDIEFVGKLDESKQQQTSLKRTLDMLEDSREHGAVLCLPCGYGKTVVALAISAVIRRKVFVLVHTQFLQQQWVDRIKAFIPKATVCVASSGQQLDDDRNAHITVGLMQSVVKFDPLLLRNYGLLIVDEGHHMPCATLRSVICKFNARYTLALTATPHGRSDGLETYLFWAVGQISQHIKASYPHVRAMLVDHTPGPYLPHLGFEERLMNDEARTERIRRILVKLVKVLGRTVLVLTQRRHHVSVLNAQFLEHGIDSVAMLGGESHDLGDIAKKEVVVATYQLVSEGFDMPTLNTLVLAMPKGDLTQVIGRITRGGPQAPIVPWVIDIVDRFEEAKRKFARRKAAYKMLGIKTMWAQY